MASTFLHRFRPHLCFLALLMLALGGAHTLRAEPENLQTPAAAAKQNNADQGVNQRPGLDQFGDPLPAGVLSRLGTVRFRHSSGITAVAFDPSGKEMITASLDHTVNRWDLATGAVRSRFRLLPSLKAGIQRSPADFLCLALAPDGKTIAAGDSSGQIWLLEGSTLKELRTLKAHASAIPALCFLSDGRTFVSGGTVKTLAVWETATGKQLRRIRNDASVYLYTLAIAPGGRTLASTGMDQTIRLWNPNTGEETQRPRTLVEPVFALAYSPDGKTLVSGGTEAMVRLWDATTYKEERQIAVQVQGVEGVAFSHDGKLLAVASREYTGSSEKHRGGIEIFDFSTGTLVRRIAGPRRPFGQVAFSPDGKTLAASGRNDSTLHTWEVATGRELGPSNAHRGSVVQVVVAPDNRTVATAASDNTVRIWDAHSGKHLQQVDGSKVWFCDNGQTLVTIVDGEDRALASWDAATGRQRFRHALPPCLLYANALSADGRTLAFARADYSIGLWDITSGKELGRLPGHKGLVGPVVFSADGKRLASASAQEKLVFVWDLDTRKEVRRFKAAPLSLAFSPDGRLLAAASSIDGIPVWDIATGAEFHWIRDQKTPLPRAWRVGFSPDGRMLVLGTIRGQVSLWEMASGRLRRSFDAFESGVNSPCFSPNGRLLLAGSPDTTALVWDLRGNTASSAALSTDALTSLWDGLASEDASRAYDAIGKLAAAAGQSVPFLRTRLRPAATPDETLIARLIASLDSDDFKTREKAAEELAAVGEAAVPALRKALSAAPSLEVRRRIGSLVEPWDSPTLTAEQLRQLRALEVLELAGTVEARAVLETLARGAPHARFTTEAQAALKRLGR